MKSSKNYLLRSVSSMKNYEACKAIEMPIANEKMVFSYMGKILSMLDVVSWMV